MHNIKKRIRRGQFSQSHHNVRNSTLGISRFLSSLRFYTGYSQTHTMS